MFSKKLKSIIESEQLSARPAYYSGRGMGYYDLNEKHIFNIFEKIKKEFGEENAMNFVSMVKDIPVLTGSQFLESLELLEMRNWKWESGLEKNASILPVDAENPSTMLMGIAHIMRDQNSHEDEVRLSNNLKKHFLKTKLPKNEYAAWEKEQRIYVW